MTPPPGPPPASVYTPVLAQRGPAACGALARHKWKHARRVYVSVPPRHTVTKVSAVKYGCWVLIWAILTTADEAWGDDRGARALVISRPHSYQETRPLELLIDALSRSPTERPAAATPPHTDRVTIRQPC